MDATKHTILDRAMSGQRDAFERDQVPIFIHLQWSKISLFRHGPYHHCGLGTLGTMKI